jgi:hypothetical protein
MFWLLSHKHYRILSLLILTEIMIMTSLINNIHLDISHKVIGIKRCHHGQVEKYVNVEAWTGIWFTQVQIT